MPKAPRTFRDSTFARSFGFALGLALVSSAIAFGCRQSQSEAFLPEASLSASADAQISYRKLRAAWFAGSTNERRKLEPELRRFLVRFPSDEPSDMVRV